MKKHLDLKKGILNSIKNELTPYSFTNSHQLFYRNNEIIRQILHIAFVNRKNGLEINPSIDICHIELEKLYSDVLGRRPTDDTATVGAELEVLAGIKNNIWIIDDKSNIQTLVQEILTKFWEYGLPFLEKYSTLESIFEVLASDDPPLRDYCVIPHIRAKKALVAAFLLRKQNTYNELIDSKISFLVRTNNPYLKDFLEFTVKFKSKLM